MRRNETTMIIFCSETLAAKKFVELLKKIGIETKTDQKAVGSKRPVKATGRKNKSNELPSFMVVLVSPFRKRRRRSY